MSQHHTQYGDLPLYIGGEACPSASDEWIEVTNPADQICWARCLKAARPEIERRAHCRLTPTRSGAQRSAPGAVRRP